MTPSPETAAGLAAWLDPSRSALAIIDMQVDFAAPWGVAGRGGADLRSVPAALSAASRLAAEARRAGATVVFVGLRTRADTDSPAWAERMGRRGVAPRQETALCRAGTPGADFHGPQPAPTDLVIAKTRYSGFVGTGLDAALKERSIDTLVVCGLTTECCVDCTVRDAFHLDYQVFLAADACASYDQGLHDATLQALDLNFAILTTSAAVEAAWAERHGPSGANHGL